MAYVDFKEPVYNISSSYPWSKEEAEKLGYKLYADINACESCHYSNQAAPYKIRYVSGECVGCTYIRLSAKLNRWLKGDCSDRPVPFPKSVEDALDLGADHYYPVRTTDPKVLFCENGPHLRKVHIKTKKCMTCQEQLTSAKLLARGPRALARANGYSTYIPLDPCPECLQQAPRNVVTNACSGCNPKLTQKSLTAQLIEATPDLIIEREVAKQAGLLAFRTGKACSKGHSGWRYVSTGNCIDCRH